MFVLDSHCDTPSQILRLRDLALDNDLEILPVINKIDLPAADPEMVRQEIEDVILVKPKVFGDNRGFFMESYKKSEFFENGITVEFNQDNHSKSSARVLRGLHYQAKPYGQAKLVRCSRGRIYDVAVDLRPNSKTF